MRSKVAALQMLLRGRGHLVRGHLVALGGVGQRIPHPLHQVLPPPELASDNRRCPPQLPLLLKPLLCGAVSRLYTANRCSAGSMCAAAVVGWVRLALAIGVRHRAG
jgi:hypothetical protein